MAVKKRAAKATKKSPVRAKAKPAAPPVSASPDVWIGTLSAATGLPPATVLDRALKAFASAHDVMLSTPVVVPEDLPAILAPPPAPKAAPAEKGKPKDKAPALTGATESIKAEAVDETPSLAPDRRLYLQMQGRPPAEVIDEEFIIGSAKVCDYWVNLPKIESRHLKVQRVNGNRYWMTDMNTAAGTVIHGEKLTEPREIKHKDTVYLAGYALLRFYIAEDT